ncbi:hypothetical protein INT45_006629 [Circinella minor]|uniref:Protein Lines N-terminal domain-containing protein n=1 Tax=Circinella minor TaxID=1195481 RepID=A0A8H7SCE7_9FUNG|nr:hypothetical protein INT45_006629 [Circinella minor]
MTDNISHSLYALNSSQSPNLALRLLNDSPWERILQNDDDPFKLYMTTRLLQQIMTLNNTNEATAQQELCRARQLWISQLVETITTHPRWTPVTTLYLDLCHIIIKDYRKHIDDMDDDDNNDKNHVGYTLLLTWLYNENVFGWIQYVLKTRQGIDLVPVVILLMDISKACKMLMERSDKNDVAQEGWIWISRHLNQICVLWLDPHVTVARRSLALVGMILRYYRNLEMIQTVLSFFVIYTKELHQRFTREQLYALFDSERTEFFYSTIDDQTYEEDERDVVDISSDDTGDKDEALSHQLQELVDYSILYQETENILEILFELHGNNDEDAVNLQLDMLSMYEKLNNNFEHNKAQSSMTVRIKHILDKIGIGPNQLFLFFCRRTGMDHSLLIDLLLSNETEFLLFFVRYLKYVERYPQDFTRECNLLGDDQEEVVDMLRSVMLAKIINILEK